MMPNRTIYVADTDVPLFEKAQALAGGNLSAAIAQALHRFVKVQEAKASGFEEVTVRVGTIAKTEKRFRGRFLAKGRMYDQNDTRRIVYEVYQTEKLRLAVYIRNVPNWGNSKGWSSGNWSPHNPHRQHQSQGDWDWNWDWSHYDWSQWSKTDSESRLDVYETLDQLREAVPGELYEAVVQALHGEEGVEFLDI